LPGLSLQHPLDETPPMRRHAGPAAPGFLRLATRPLAGLWKTWLRLGLHNGDGQPFPFLLKLAVAPSRRCLVAVSHLPLLMGLAGCGRARRARQVPSLLQEG